MAIGTYSDLQAAIATWMIRSDLTAQIPQFIALAEDRFNKVIRRPEMETIASLTTVASTGTLALPSDFLQARSIYLDGDAKVVLEQLAPGQLVGAYPAEWEGSPVNYDIRSGNTLVIGPVPDEAYDLVLDYYAKIPALTDSVQSNWLLDAHSDLYLAASLAEGFAFTVDAERGPYWEGKAMQKLGELRVEGIKKALGGPLRARSSAAPSGRVARY